MSQNTLLPETKAASDAAIASAEARGICVLEPKPKYRVASLVKKTRDKGGGNSGNAGRKWRRKQRGHAGGQISSEEKQRREEQSRNARANQKPKIAR